MIILTDMNLLAETMLYYGLIGLGVLLVLTIFLLIVLNRAKKTPKKHVDLDFILSLFNKDNILEVNYVRNKIVIDFKDVELVDVNLLHERGAKGVSIIGDRIKFYFDGGEEKNHQIFTQIKNFIEG